MVEDAVEAGMTALARSLKFHTESKGKAGHSLARRSTNRIPNSRKKSMEKGIRNFHTSFPFKFESYHLAVSNP